MTDPSQQCPSAWREYNTSRVKACGRPDNSTGSCAAEFYLPIVSTAEYVEELLATKLDVQMPLDDIITIVEI